MNGKHYGKLEILVSFYNQYVSLCSITQSDSVYSTIVFFLSLSLSSTNKTNQIHVYMNIDREWINKVQVKGQWKVLQVKMSKNKLESNIQCVNILKRLPFELYLSDTYITAIRVEWKAHFGHLVALHFHFLIPHSFHSSISLIHFIELQCNSCTSIQEFFYNSTTLHNGKRSSIELNFNSIAICF